MAHLNTGTCKASFQMMCHSFYLKRTCIVENLFYYILAANGLFSFFVFDMLHGIHQLLLDVSFVAVHQKWRARFNWMQVKFVLKLMRPRICCHSENRWDLISDSLVVLINNIPFLKKVGLYFFSRSRWTPLRDDISNKWRWLGNIISSCYFSTAYSIGLLTAFGIDRVLLVRIA